MFVSLENFLTLRKHQPVVDVRSPGEFDDGHIPGALNIPILNNEERKIVGVAYKEKGQQEAIREGFKLVGPRLSEIISDTEKIANENGILVHCWRGGMRSGNFCQFASMAKIKTNSLEGGYKAYRQFALESFKKTLPIVLLTGFTGSGKSDVLRAIARQGGQVLDLEAMANHKGSAFGGLGMPLQPTTEQFQNQLFEAILKLDVSKPVWVEDESLAIGRIFLPTDFWNTMNQSPMVKMEVPKSVRIKRLVEEYGAADRGQFLEIMGKIVKRLGGQHYKTAKESLMVGNMDATIDTLLTYYDKAYQQSIGKRSEHLISTLAWEGNDPDAFAAKLIGQQNDLQVCQNH